MNLGWKSIVVAGIAITALGITGYAAYTYRQASCKANGKKQAKTGKTENASTEAAVQSNAVAPKKKKKSIPGKSK